MVIQWVRTAWGKEILKGFFQKGFSSILVALGNEDAALHRTTRLRGYWNRGLGKVRWGLRGTQNPKSSRAGKI